ncbi:MAG: hypothetical protein JKY37_05430, partial [Nannocystaceae bacterium]|nr:hypothetical protein [Nannocystaceae bacterium]
MPHNCLPSAHLVRFSVVALALCVGCSGGGDEDEGGSGTAPTAGQGDGTAGGGSDADSGGTNADGATAWMDDDADETG